MNKFEEEQVIYDLLGLMPSQYDRRSKNKFISPFRRDDNPGCYFETEKYQHIRFMDWGDLPLNKMSVYDIACVIATGHRVMGNADFQKAKEVIAQRSSVVISKNFVKQDNEGIPVNTKIYVSYTPRSVTISDIKFWNPVGITTTQLINDRVYPVKDFILDYGNGGKKIMIPKTITYAMVFRSGNIKLYSPLEPPETKWGGFSAVDDIFCDNDNERGHTQYLVEGYRDCRVIRNEGFIAKGLQSVSMLPCKEKLELWERNFCRNVLLFDPDKAGQKASAELLKQVANIGLKSYFVGVYPMRVMETADEKGKTDITRFRQLRGKLETKKIINQVFIYK